MIRAAVRTGDGLSRNRSIAYARQPVGVARRCGQQGTSGAPRCCVTSRAIPSNGRIGAVLRLVFLLLTSTGSAQLTDPRNRDEVLAVVNVSVIPMSKAELQSGQTVVIRGGRIAAIGPFDRTVVPSGATRIDGTGKYLIPGLVDSHVHLTRNAVANRALLMLFLVNGVTTVFNLEGAPAHLDLRSSVARGEAEGPRIFTSGPGVGSPHGQVPTTTPQEIASDVAKQKRAGYDFIKLHGDLSPETYRELNATSRLLRMPLIGHAPRNLGFAAMIGERQQAVAHVEEYLYAYFYHKGASQGKILNVQEKIGALAKATADAGTTVISTLEVYRGIADQISDLDGVLNRPEVAYLPRAVGAAWGWWPPNNTYARRFEGSQIPLFRDNYRTLEQVVLGLQQAGAPLLAGTDTPTSAVVPGFSIHHELRDLVRAGLTPYQALRAATVNPAIFSGFLRDSGTIEPQKRADCVLLKANPLEEIANTSAIAGVVRNGKWISEARIRNVLEGMRNRTSADGARHLPQSAR